MVAGFKLIEKLYPEEEAKKGAHGGKRRKVVGIDASAKPAETRAQVLRIAKDTAEKIGLGAEQITEEDIVLDERYHAGVYGIPDKQTWDMVRRGKISSGYVLHAHLDGLPACSEYIFSWVASASSWCITQDGDTQN
ncbi:hypothetical protein RJZ90_004864 [Blastomyces dermatitidis]